MATAKTLSSKTRGKTPRQQGATSVAAPGRKPSRKPTAKASGSQAKPSAANAKPSGGKAKSSGTKPAGAQRARLSLGDAMGELERAGSAQTRKTYLRHGAAEPMFGVSFATLQVLRKRIGVDHELALLLWDTGNFDARNLAVKIVDPARMTSRELDRWAATPLARMCSGYVGMVTAEGPHAMTKAVEWLTNKAELLRTTGWTLLAQLAQRDEAAPDTFFEQWLRELERAIHSAPNAERYAMNMAVIALGCRSPGMKQAALAAAKRIGKVEVDHGDTSCKTPDAATYIEQAWTHSKAKGFASPAAQERARENIRLRC